MTIGMQINVDHDAIELKNIKLHLNQGRLTKVYEKVDKWQII